MEIAVEELFIYQLQKCPVAFQQKFRRIYQQLKVVDKPTEVKKHLCKFPQQKLLQITH